MPCSAPHFRNAFACAQESHAENLATHAIDSKSVSDHHADFTSKTPQGLLFLSCHLTEVMNDIHGTLRGHWCVPFQLFNLLTVFFLASEYPTLPGISSLPTVRPPAQTQDA
jgi:hypothetical protein